MHIGLARHSKKTLWPPVQGALSRESHTMSKSALFRPSHGAGMQVWMMTGGPMGADSYRGADQDEDYQAESPAPSNQVCLSVQMSFVKV